MASSHPRTDILFILLKLRTMRRKHLRFYLLLCCSFIAFMMVLSLFQGCRQKNKVHVKASDNVTVKNTPTIVATLPKTDKHNYLSPPAKQPHVLRVKDMKRELEEEDDMQEAME